MKTTTIFGASAVVLMLVSGCDRLLGLEHRQLYVPPGVGGGGTSCSDGAKNGDETDLDCGGSCAPCVNGKGCDVGPDCESLVCVGGTCVGATCSDKIKNGDETDVDCGGNCGKCGPGQDCAGPTDCKSAACIADECASTCADKLKGGSETDVDCGGGDCPACANEQTCTVGGDCESGVCEATVCSAYHVWSQDFGNANLQNATPTSVTSDDAKNVLLAGYFGGTIDFGGGPMTGKGVFDIFLAKFDVAGKPIWSKQFGGLGAAALALGSSSDAVGNIWLTGTFFSTISFGPGIPLTSVSDSDAFVVKLDPFGKHVWSRRFGTTGVHTGVALAVDSAGAVIIAGTIAGTADFGGGLLTSKGGNDVFVVKLDAAGGYVWSKRFGNVEGQDPSSVAVDVSGNATIAGTFSGSIDFGGEALTSTEGKKNAFVMRLGASGEELWSKQSSESGNVSNVRTAVAKDGAVLVAGDFSGTMGFGGQLLIGAGKSDLFLAKLDASGTHVWSRRFGDGNDQSAARLAIDVDGNPVLSSNGEGAIDFGGGPLSSAGGSSGGADIFVAKFDAAGGHLWSRRFGDDELQSNAAVIVDSGGHVLVSGNFNGKLDFGGGPLKNAGGVRIFLAKLLTP